MRRPLRLLLLASGLLVLAGCSRREPPPCPSVVAVPGAERLTRFEGDSRDLTDVLFEAEFQGIRLECDVDDDVVEATLHLRIVIAEGPANTSGHADVTYFVAIGTRDRRILAREAFALDIPFSGNRRRVAATEQIDQRIPLKPGQSGADYIVYVGLAVRPDELRYNQQTQ